MSVFISTPNKTNKRGKARQDVQDAKFALDLAVNKTATHPLFMQPLRWAGKNNSIH